MRLSFRSRVASLAIPALLGGCSMAPHYERPAAPVPMSWPVGDAYLAQSEAALPRLSHQQVFADPRLLALIDAALENNRDLRVAAANVLAARAQYRIQRATILPEIGVTGSVTRRDSDAPGGAGDATSYALNAGASAFELDLFGRLRAQGNAALNRYFGEEAAARATRLALVAELARAYATYAADASLLALARETAANAERSVALTRTRLEGGIAPRTDLRQAEQILETARRSVAVQTSALAQDVNALRLLVGAPIESMRLPGAIDEVVVAYVPPPAGLDSGILLRRPDVVEAEYALRAANAEIGAARAAMFPRLSLTGLAGFASDALSALFKTGSFSTTLGASANYSIFSGGAGRAGVASSKAQRDAALAAYEKAVQSAFRDVSDALAERGTIDAQLAASRAFVAAADDNYRLSDMRYRGGVDSFLASLDAQRALFSARQTLIATQLAAANNVAALYSSLGGDDFGVSRQP